MAAARKNLVIEQGATFTLDMVYRQSNGTPVNLTGYSARMQIRLRHESPTALLSFTTQGGSIVLGGALGTIVVTATATQTAALPARSAVYDLELVAPDTTVTRLMQGSVTITPEVTR